MTTLKIFYLTLLLLEGHVLDTDDFLNPMTEEQEERGEPEEQEERGEPEKKKLKSKASDMETTVAAYKIENGNFR